MSLPQRRARGPLALLVALTPFVAGAISSCGVHGSEETDRAVAPLDAMEAGGASSAGSTTSGGGESAESLCGCPVGPGEKIFVARGDDDDDSEPTDLCKERETHASCLSDTCVVEVPRWDGFTNLEIRQCGWPAASPQPKYGCRCPVDEKKGELLAQDKPNGCLDVEPDTCSWELCTVIAGTTFRYETLRKCEFVPEPPPCACPAFDDEYVDPAFDGCASPKEKLECRAAKCLVDGWDVRDCAWVAEPPPPLPDTPCACPAGEGEYVPVGEKGAVNDCLPQPNEEACLAKTCTVAIGDPDDAAADEWVTRGCGWTPPCACPIGPREELRESEDLSNMCPHRDNANSCSAGICAVGAIGEDGYEIRSCAWNPEAPVQ